MQKVHDVITFQNIAIKRRTMAPVILLAVISLTAAAGFFIYRASLEAATGDIILLWEDDAIPAGWECLSCSATGMFFGVFPRGSSTFGTASSGADTHTPTAAFISHTAGATVGNNAGAGTVLNSTAVSHGVTNITLSASSQAPLFKNYRFIRANTSTLPAGIIGMFDVSSSSLPVGWQYVTSTAGRYLRGESATSTGGTSEHGHALSASATAATANLARGGGGTQVGVANGNHTHAISGSVAPASNTPPFINVVFAKLTAPSVIPVGLIAMFDAAAPVNWTPVSGVGGDFNGRFPRSSDTYGIIGGSATHQHATTTVTSGGPSTTNTTRSGASTNPVTNTHTHNFTFGNFSSDDSNPVYRDTVFAKFNGAADVRQVHYHWRNDDGDESGATSMTGGSEDTGISEVSRNQIVRLRYEVSNEGSATSTGAQYRIEFAAATSGPWAAVDTAGTAWVMASTSQLTDASNTSNIATSTGGVTDENPQFIAGQQKESGNQTGGITLGPNGFTEVEYAIKPLNASNSQVYYFRLTDAGTPLGQYDRFASATTAGVITVSSTGNQNATTSIPSTDFYVGGAFTFSRDQGSATVTQMIITASGTVDEAANLLNLEVYYETTPTCSFQGNESLFGAAAVFNGSGKATTTGEMGVGTSQVCVYVVLDVAAGAVSGQTIEVLIGNPSTEVVVTRGDVSSSASVEIPGTTTLETLPGITVGIDGTQKASTTIPSTDFYVGGAFTFTRSAGNATVTQIIISETGSITSTLNLSNLRLYHETTSTCDFAGTETLFGSAASFSASGTREIATVAGTLNVGVSQACMYVVVDVGSGALGGETVEIEITNPSVEVTVSVGQVNPATPVALSGDTALVGPTVEVGITGTQIATTSIPSSNFYVGGAFTLRRNVNNATVTQIVVTASGTVDAQTHLSNADIYYETAAPCSFGGSETLFGTAASFNASKKATVIGSMNVATSQMCVYVVLDVGEDVPDGDTLEIEITNPSTDVTVSSGVVRPISTVEIAGSTVLQRAAITFTQRNFKFYSNQDDVQPGVQLANENASATDVASGVNFRLRINIAVGGSKLATSSQEFKLQYAAKGGFSNCTDVPSVNYADVGEIGSSTVWRGYNFGPAANDGDSISAFLLSSSTVRQSYEEANNSTSNIRAISVGGVGEWDWALQNNAADSGTNYCFRVVKSDGSALNSYVNIAELRTRSPATWRAPENTATSTDKNSSVRLRIEISNEGNTSSSVRLRLEYASSVAGTWTAVPFSASCTSTSTHFRLCYSDHFVDGDRTANKLTAEEPTFISGMMVESSTLLATTTLQADEFTEYEWNIQATDAAIGGLTYYFRVTDNGASIGTYAVYPQIMVTTSGTPMIAQNYYRFYVDNNQINPTDPWPPGGSDLGENTSIAGGDDPPGLGEVVRIRMSIQVSNAPLSALSQRFALEYGERTGGSCSAIPEVEWFPVGQFASTTQWRGFDGTPSDGATIGAFRLSVTDASGTYEEANDSALNPYTVFIGDDAEYDWVVQHNNATSGAVYCFRVVKNDGTPLNSYNNYPTIVTAIYQPASQNWRWYNDENNETPLTALAGENIAPADIAYNNTVKLRFTIADVAGAAGTNIKFRLQFSEYSDFSQGVGNVQEVGSCVDGVSLWCYGNGVDGDDDPIITRVLSDSTASGRHNEMGSSTSTFDPAANTPTEFEFTIRQAGARANAVYYFRAFHHTAGQAVPLNTGESYPSLATEGAQLTFTISGLPVGTTTEGIVTDISTTATGVQFGSLPFGTSSRAAQRLAVSTNASEGYSILIYQRQGLQRSGGYEIDPFAASNESPATWLGACAATSTGCYGYHSGDDTLSGGSTRFAVNDTYARFETAAKEVAYNSGPATNESTDMIYRIEVSDQQPAGDYEGSVVYIVIPVF